MTIDAAAAQPATSAARRAVIASEILIRAVSEFVAETNLSRTSNVVGIAPTGSASSQWTAGNVERSTGVSVEMGAVEMGAGVEKEIVPRALRPGLVGTATSAVLFGIVTLLVVLQATGGIDGWARALAESSRTPILTTLAFATTSLGSYRFVIVEAVVLAVVLAVWSRGLIRPLLLLAAVASTSSLEFLLKIAIGRARPPAELALGPAALDYSFPSGHTTSGTTVFLLGVLLVAGLLHRRIARRVVTAAGVLISVLIGLSRIYLGYHWLTDVVGAWLLAATLTAMALFVLGFLHPPSRPTQTVVEPCAQSTALTRSR